ncbi:MAG: motility protein A [Phycisphaerales bacterium]
MDIASLIGAIISVVCMGIVFFEASHGNLAMFFSMEGVLMVFGGSISVCFMAMPMEKLKCVPGFLKRFMFHKSTPAVHTIESFAVLVEKARREGVLSLETDIPEIEARDKFLGRSIRMVIDGTDPGVIEYMLRMEILSMQERHKAGKKFFDLIKLYGPGWGLVGTLVGQIGMFGNLGSGSVETLGKMLAVAVCATMYGTVLCNAVAGPIGDKLATRSSEEMLNREMVLQGVLSMQAGDNPRVTISKMSAFLPESGRAKLKLAA